VRRSGQIRGFDGFVSQIVPTTPLRRQRSAGTVASRSADLGVRGNRRLSPPLREPGGHRPLKVAARVRIPLGVLHPDPLVSREDTLSPAGLRAQPPWLHRRRAERRRCCASITFAPPADRPENAALISRRAARTLCVAELRAVQGERRCRRPHPARPVRPDNAAGQAAGAPSPRLRSPCRRSRRGRRRSERSRRMTRSTAHDRGWDASAAAAFRRREPRDPGRPPSCPVVAWLLRAGADVSSWQCPTPLGGPWGSGT
jgi:hypothetical protein